LTTDIKDARVHCAVLKLRVGPSSSGACLERIEVVQPGPMVHPAVPA